MDIETNIKSLERRHQELSRDFKAGKIDEATFTAEVDRLQFQDSWGRYWMLGAQSGMWHYYDGQAWQQADPRQADRLPFMDDQGRSLVKYTVPAGASVLVKEDIEIKKGDILFEWDPYSTVILAEKAVVVPECSNRSQGLTSVPDRSTPRAQERCREQGSGQ